jgi:hypothetical protein
MPTKFDSVEALATVLRRAAQAPGHDEEEMGHPDADWPDGCGLFMVGTGAGEEWPT